MPGVKQPLFTEVPYSSFKKSKLFSWIIFFGEDFKFPFATLFSWLSIRYEKGGIFYTFFTIPKILAILKFSRILLWCCILYICTHKLQISQQTALFVATALAQMLYGNFYSVITLTKKFVQKLYKMYTKLYKTLNLYIFCIQRLYKSKFCMIMNVQKMYIKILHIYKTCTNCTKLVQSLDQKQLETWNVCFLYI